MSHISLGSDRLCRLRQLFEEVLLLQTGQRAAYLQHACEDDVELAAEIENMVAAVTTSSNRGPGNESADAVPKNSHIGPYRLIRELGHGGMGRVYLAVRDDEVFRMKVAVKLLRKDRIGEEFLHRFRQERQLLAGLDHPNIARILDGGTDTDGTPYYAMEYIEGDPLDTFCNRRQHGLTERLRLFQQLCAAVHYLHENRIIHRDLKPSNVLVTEQSVVKILDFGIAKASLPGAPSATLEIPAAGRLLTPGYASPEQVAGEPVHSGSDVYTLGVMLYEVITGNRPFDQAAKDLDSWLRAVDSRDPPLPSQNIRCDIPRTTEPWGQLRKRVMGDLDNIVLKAMKRSPEHRYASAHQLSADLESFLGGRSIIARPTPWPDRLVRYVKRNRRAALATCALVAMLTIAGWQWAVARANGQQADRANTALDAAKRELQEAQHKLAERLRSVDARGSSTKASGSRYATEGRDLTELEQIIQGLVDRDFSADIIRQEASVTVTMAAEWLRQIERGLSEDRATSLAVIRLYQKLEAIAARLGDSTAAQQYLEQASLLQVGLARMVADANDPIVHPDRVRRKRTVDSSATSGGQSVEKGPEDQTPHYTQPGETGAHNRTVDQVRTEALAKEEAAAHEIAELRAENGFNGMGVHSTITVAQKRMQSHREAAEGHLRRGELDDAVDSFRLTEGEAKKILRLLGRPIR